MKSIPLIGYSDKISLRSEETISFKVSSTLKTPFTASLKRSISADPNPLGTGIIEQDASKYFKTNSFKSRTQDFNPGSYAISKKSIKINIKKELCINVIIFPTLSTDGKQTILSFDNLELYIDSNGRINLSIEKENISVDEPLLLNSWYELKIKFLKNGKTTISQKPIKNEYQNKIIYKTKFNLKTILNGKLSLAALITKQQITNHYNGKIEAPKIIVDGKKVFECDLSSNTSFSYVKSTVGPMLMLKNFPTRAVTSSKWDGSEMNWQHKPDHYSAIYFHNDDIYDFEWDTDFKFKIPNNMPSGIYVMKISGEGYEDSMPFFVDSKSPCSGLRHFQADSHLISWLHNKELDYEIVTDEQLHEDGYKANKKYKTLITGSHPEYHTKETLDALSNFRDKGGSLNYLGGNGFYWRIAVHKENKSLLEIRRP